jgi:hypothetical protein
MFEPRLKKALQLTIFCAICWAAYFPISIWAFYTSFAILIRIPEIVVIGLSSTALVYSGISIIKEEAKVWLAFIVFISAFIELYFGLICITQEFNGMRL